MNKKISPSLEITQTLLKKKSQRIRTKMSANVAGNSPLLCFCEPVCRSTFANSSTFPLSQASASRGLFYNSQFFRSVRFFIGSSILGRYLQIRIRIWFYLRQVVFFKNVKNVKKKLFKAPRSGFEFFLRIRIWIQAANFVRI